jgi:hypothetical protein
LVVNPVKLAGWYAYHVVAQGMFGARLASGSGALAALLAGLALLLVGSAATLVLQGRAGDRTPIIALAGAMSMLFFVAPVMLAGVSAPRYAVVPVLLLYSALACLLDAGLRHVPAVLWRRVQLATLTVVVLAAWTSYLSPGPRANGPRWDAELSRATATCPPAPVPTVISVPIPPVGWNVPLTCRVLTESQARTRTSAGAVPG